MTPSLSHRLRNASTALAGMVNAGELAGASADARFALRCLSIELAAWADEAEGLPDPKTPAVFPVASGSPVVVAFPVRGRAVVHEIRGERV
jgi:hypothetical protein